MAVIRVGLDPPYEIHIGKGALALLPSIVRLEGRRVLVVTDSTVARIHLNAALEALGGAKGLAALSFVVIPAGERNKGLKAVEKIYGAMHEMNLDRGGLVVALGGGVVGDVAGFAAATWCRGVGCVQVPTTVLAISDSSVGGKTGVDYRGRKNGVGAFFQPEAVIADTALLSTLPEREFSNGMAEVIKYAMIGDPVLLDLLESEKPPVEELLERSVRVKVAIVERDPKEKGDRALCNFGHTFGHAIESWYKYRKWLHGEAVALGMAIACPDARLARILERWKLPVRDPALDLRLLAGLVGMDKKNENGTLRFIRVDSPGKPRIEKLDAAGVEALIRDAAARQGAAR